MFRKLLVMIAVSLFAGPTYADQDLQTWDEVCAQASSQLAEGDLIFLDIPNFLFRQVAAATNSWTSHVGIAFKDVNGSWVVAESTVPLSKLTPLCDYLKKSSKFNFEIRRLNNSLSDEQTIKLKSSASSMINKFYDLGFNFDSNRFFCSKFVYLAYSSIGIEVGELEPFKELLSQNPQASLSFWKYWFLGNIPWNRRTVTPASQLNDPEFYLVHRAGGMFSSNKFD